ncbi:uncharacterized protein LTHEOB_9257 [Lasiodiplodia theobromae]|uniref:uncharacterized protein n=1 Tax=Lasiodiplodia theobromae TaxID=45133 RepID=UPI0015C382BD|nr:uncharacterized protein LTHEOB_9257 [Lasiodiplodia theobromae]KAF4540161.1 hypothetical protein LTHEOB_9257 [Lasiodiplodia theobromae]
MAASIILDPQQPFYLSGDTVKGRVRYQCLKPRAVERVEVKFWGRVKTTISEKNNLSGLYNQYRDRVCLFEDNLISDVNTTLATGVHNWPFAFTFPTTAAPREVKSWDSKRTEKQLPETVLPPSFQLNAQGLLTGYYSFIAYSLVAYVHFSDRKLKKKPETAEILLEFIPSADDKTPELEGDAPHDKDCSIRGFELVPESERPKLKRFSFSNPTKPTFRFRITASTPKYVRPTEPWRLLVALEVLPPESKDVTVATPPQFVLKSINIKMNSKLVLRVVRGMEHVRQIREDDAGVTFQNMGVLTPGKPKEIAMGQLKYKPATTNLSSVSRRYKLLVEAVIETADGAQSFKLKCKEPVTVGALPVGARGGGEAQAQLRGNIEMAILKDLAATAALAGPILEMLAG